MRARAPSLALFLTVALSPGEALASSPSATYQQDTGPEGLVWIEAGDWSSSRPAAGLEWEAQGGEGRPIALVAQGPTRGGEAVSSPAVTYRVIFTRSGTHFLWVRGRGPGREVSVDVAWDDEKAPFCSGLRLPAVSSDWARRDAQGARATFTVPVPGEYELSVRGRDVGTSLERLVVTSDDDLDPSTLGPETVPPLVAYYTRVRSEESWESLERVGPHADVVVALPRLGGRLVFWRGSSYRPFWETDAGRWFVEERIPRRGDGAAERPDRTNLYARADLVESAPSRALVRWRYVPDPRNPGLDGWAEEYFEVRPNGRCLRSIRMGAGSLEDWGDPERLEVFELRLGADGLSSSPHPTSTAGVPLSTGPGVGDRGPSADPYGHEVPVLPEGPSDPGPFGAYHTHLRYFEEWDEPWRVGPHADVVVQFDDHPHRLVFWRGADYVPHWANDENHWYNNEFVERRAADSGLEGCCAEPMQDHEARYSNARVIASHDARAIVHWRYAPSDRNYDLAYVDEITGWSDRVDEYYVVYPDAVAVRAATLYTSAPHKFSEWHEAIPLVNPGKIPEDVLEMEAVALTDLQGNDHVYSWKDGFPKTLDDGRGIMLVNLKGTTRPFVVVESRGVWVDEISLPDQSRFNHYDDWPGWPARQRRKDWTRNPVTGYREFWKILPSHSSLMHFMWDDYAQDLEGPVKWKTKIMLHGLTPEREVNALVPLARSWENPPVLRLEGGGYTGGAYDKAQRAYRVEATTRPARALHGTLVASEESPLAGVSLVIHPWSEGTKVDLVLDGRPVPAGPGFRQGLERNPDGGLSLVVWLDHRATSPVALTLGPR